MSSWPTTVSCYLLLPRITRQDWRPMSAARRHVAVTALVALSLEVWACALGAAPAAPGVGESLYRRGLLPSGVPVEAAREAGATLRGADPACANCHRRSGLGS